MGAVRCQHCGAAVPSRADWCTLCYADLRPVPEPAVPLAAAAAEGSGTGRPGATQVVATRHVASQDVASQVGASQDVASQVGELSWPCLACGTANAYDTQDCSACGVGFLAPVHEAAAVLTRVPGIGDVTRLSTPRRVGLGLVVGAGLTVAILLFATVLGLLA